MKDFLAFFHPGEEDILTDPTHCPNQPYVHKVQIFLGGGGFRDQTCGGGGNLCTILNIMALTY